MNDITFSILQSVVSIFVLLVMRYVIPYLKIKLESKIDTELLRVVLNEVKSVEQEGLLLPEDKKAEVFQRTVEWVNNHHVSITKEQLMNLIETAVYTMKNEVAKDEQR